MLRAVVPLLVILALPASAEEPNLSATSRGEPGSAAQLILAQRVYVAAVEAGEAVSLLAAVRLARAVTIRPATGWAKTSTGKPPIEPASGDLSAPDPAGEAALTILRNLAGEDPDLQDLVFDLDAQVPGGRVLTSVEARSDLASGQTDLWRLPLFGQVAAEIGLIGDGDGSLQMAVQDESGATICAQPATIGPVLCRFTPARNGFFSVTVTNAGETANSYRLIGN